MHAEIPAPFRCRFARRLRRGAPVAALALLTATLAAPAEARRGADRDPSLRVEIRDGDGDRISFAVSSEWLGGLIDGTHLDLDCDGTDDAGLARMMTELERDGEGAAWRGVDEDGDALYGRRHGGQLTFESRDEGDERTELEMPWPLARCLLGGREPEGGLRRALASGDLDFRLVVRDGGDQVRISLED